MQLTNFASGELSPTLAGRVDLQQYYQGAGKLQNFNVIPTGGIVRRTGTQRIASLSGACVLIPFILNKDTSFVLECTPLKIYVWKNGAKMLDSSGSQVSMTVPWASLAEIREVQYAQNYDTMIFVHENYRPFEIVYNSGTGTFTYSVMAFDFIPDVKLDDDYDYVVVVESDIMPSGEFDGQYCIFNGKLYKWSTSDSEWSIDSTAEDPESEEELFTTAGKYPSCVTFYNSRLWFASTSDSRQKIWASAAPDTTGNRYNDFSTYIKYVTVSKVVKDPDLHVFSGKVDVAADDDDDGSTVYDGQILYDLTQDMSGDLTNDVTDYYCSSDVIPVGTKVLELLTVTSTLLAALAVYKAWVDSGKTGDDTSGLATVEKAHYLKLLTLTENSYAIIVNESATENATAQAFTIQLWKYASSSTADDYEYSVVNNNMTASDCSFYFEIASDQNDCIKWLAPSKYLVVGTESSEYCIPSSVTALNTVIEMNGRHGTDTLQATCVDTAIIFFAQGKKAIREYYWNSDEEAFKSNNIAMLAPQMLEESAAVDFDYMNTPYARLIIVRSDGIAAVMLYEKNSGVMAWNRFVCGSGSIVSCAVTRGDSGCDFVYFAVNDSGTYYLEKLDMENDVYLDGWETYTGSTDGYTDTAYVFNKTKHETWLTQKTASETDDSVSDPGNDPSLYPISEIPDGFYTAGDTAYIGYLYDSIFKSMPIVDTDPTGKKRITKLLVRFYDAYMPELEVETVGTEQFNTVPGPFSGIRNIDYPGESDRDVTFTLTINKPHKCTILSVEAKTA